MRHFNFRADAILDALQGRHRFDNFAVVIVHHDAVGQRPDDGDAFDFIFVERQKIIFVFQQHYGFLRDFQRDRAVGGTVDHVRRNFAERHGIERIKIAKAKAHAQQARQRIVQSRLGKFAVAHGGRNVVLKFLVGKIAARHQRLRDGILVSHLFFLMAFDHRAHAAQIGNHRALKAPVIFQNVCEQPVVDIVGRAVDRVVAGHDRLRAAFDHRVAPVR